MKSGGNSNLLAIVAVLMACSGLAHAAAMKTLVVADDGSGQFKTVQEALDAAPDGNVRIEIKPGEYRQVVAITANGVELHGMGKRPEDVVLVYDNTHASAGGTGKSATVTVTGDDFTAENLTMANDFEKHHDRTADGSQAVALRVIGDREVFRHIRLLGYQDTLYADSKTCHSPSDTGPCLAARQYFADCYIEGHVDFIFGDAKAVFDHCEIHAMAHPVITLTAQSRLRPSEDSGYRLPRLHRHRRSRRRGHPARPALARLLHRHLPQHRLQSSARPEGLGRVGRPPEDQRLRGVRLERSGWRPHPTPRSQPSAYRRGGCEVLHQSMARRHGQLEPGKGPLAKTCRSHRYSPTGIKGHPPPLLRQNLQQIRLRSGSPPQYG